MSKTSTDQKSSTGYKQTNLGPLPNTWEAVLLGDLFVFKNGLNKAKRFFGSGTPIVNYMDVFEHPGLRLGDLSGRVSLTPEEIRNFKVQRGDVFFTRTSETVEEIGVASVMLYEPHDTVFSGFVLRARPRDGQLNNSYKQYCFAHKVVRSQIISNATYTTRALTNGRTLSTVWIAIPPTPEQRAIAEALSDVDGLLNALEALIAKKRAIKQAVMQQLLTGKTRLPGFSGAWETKQLGEIFTIRAGSSKSQYITQGGKYIIVDMGSVATDGQLIISKFTHYEGDFLKEGDLVMPKDDIGGGKIIGKVAYIDANNLYVLGDHVYALRLIEGFPKFFSYLINRYETNSTLKSKVGGSAQLGLSRKAVVEQEVPIPTYDEQHAIASVLSDIDTEIAALAQRRDKTRAIKQGMMQQLLTGQVRLSESRICTDLSDDAD